MAGLLLDISTSAAFHPDVRTSASNSGKKNGGVWGKVPLCSQVNVQHVLPSSPCLLLRSPIILSPQTDVYCRGSWIAFLLEECGANQAGPKTWESFKKFRSGVFNVFWII